jgi:hypothetical protein
MLSIVASTTSSFMHLVLYKLGEIFRSLILLTLLRLLAPSLLSPHRVNKKPVAELPRALGFPGHNLLLELRFLSY